MEIIIKKDEKLPTYEELFEHWCSTIGLWCIDQDPRDVNLNWIRANAFQLKSIKSPSNISIVVDSL